MDTTEAELVLDGKASLGEGSLWDPRSERLLWVDIDRGELHIFDPRMGKDRSFSMGEPVSTVVPRRSGGLLLGLRHDFTLFNPESSHRTTIHGLDERSPDIRFNDGKCDPAGRFWAGTISLSRHPDAAALYCLQPDHSIRRVLGNLTNSNGLIWSPDGSIFYHIDTPTLRVWAFDYEMRSGEISNRHPVVTVPGGAGKPDGMTIDSEGFLWVALWGGGCVMRWDPRTGAPVQKIVVPAAHVSSCAFGGPDLDELYITTARGGLTPEQLREQPHAGGIFRARPGVRGIEANFFAG